MIFREISIKSSLGIISEVISSSFTLFNLLFLQLKNEKNPIIMIIINCLDILVPLNSKLTNYTFPKQLSGFLQREPNLLYSTHKQFEIVFSPIQGRCKIRFRAQPSRFLRPIRNRLATKSQIFPHHPPAIPPYSKMHLLDSDKSHREFCSIRQPKYLFG